MHEGLRRGDMVAPLSECFMGSGIEVLVCGNAFLRKERHSPGLKLDYKNVFEND